MVAPSGPMKIKINLIQKVNDLKMVFEKLTFSVFS